MIDVRPQTSRRGPGWLFDWVVDRSLAVLFIGFTGLSFVQVVSRYLFRHPITWSEEISRYLFVWVVFLGAGMAERHRAHVTLDFLVTRFSPRVRYWLAVVNGVLTLTMVLVFFVWYGWSLTEVAMRQVSPFGGPPVGFGVLAIPVGGLLMALNIVRAALWPPEAEAGS